MVSDPNKALSALLGILLGLLAFALAVPWMGGYLHPPQEESAASLEGAQPFPSEKPLLPQPPSASPQDPTSLIKKDSAGSLPQEEATQQEGRQRGKKVAQTETELKDAKKLSEKGIGFEDPKVEGKVGLEKFGFNKEEAKKAGGAPFALQGRSVADPSGRFRTFVEGEERGKGAGGVEQRGRFASIPETKFPGKSGGKQESDLEIKELKKAEQRSASPTEPEKTLVADAGRQRLPPIGRPSGGRPSGSTGGVGTGTPIPDPPPNVRTCENCRTICPGDTCPAGFECDTLNCPAGGACTSDGSENAQCIRCEATCDQSDCPSACNGPCTLRNPCSSGQACQNSQCVDCTAQFCDNSDCPAACGGRCNPPACPPGSVCAPQAIGWGSNRPGGCYDCQAIFCDPTANCNQAVCGTCHDPPQCGSCQSCQMNVTIAVLFGNGCYHNPCPGGCPPGQYCRRGCDPACVPCCSQAPTPTGCPEGTTCMCGLFPYCRS